MRLVKLVPLFLVLFSVALILFMPGREIYYYIEKRIFENGIIVDSEEVSEKLAGVVLEHPAVLIDGAEVMDAERVSITMLLVYNRVVIVKPVFSRVLGSILPGKTERIVVTYIPFMGISMKTESELGNMSGYIDPINRTIHLEPDESEEPGGLKSYLIKSEKGWYYERNY